MSGLVKMDPIVTPEFPVDPLQLLGEKSFGKPRHVPVEEVGTPIQEFFRDASVLVTGGTGFMGKTVTEKLLRSCPHLKRIYLIVRTKKGKRGQDRLDDILSDRVSMNKINWMIF
uniref:Fatty acyl-CoA reductase n=1 Tax=Cacopsylla melanoneura TaxID=428564 RepID=A0A8D8WIZ3_9HEMI